MNFKRVMVGSVVGAAIVASPAAFAGWTGNVGASSKYLFRGIAQNGDAAVQGGMDYGHESGLYFGTWASNIGFGGAGGESSEVDVYAGWGADLGGLGVDLGVLYYWYPEEDETATELSTLELSVGLSMGPVSAGVAYADELKFFGVTGANGEYGDGTYLSLGIDLPVSEKLGFSAGIGQYSGQAIEDYLGSIGSTDDSYTDLNVTLTAAASEDISVSFGFVKTDISNDDMGFVAGFSYGFGL